MRKTISQNPQQAVPQQGLWFDLDKLATVEISSEDPLFPIEQALLQPDSTGWRASKMGPQFIRLKFDHPISIHRIQLRIVERAAERMQELSLSAEIAGEGQRELRRQQFTFSPHGATEEIEDFSLDLEDVSMLELRIDPDRSHDPTLSRNYASLASLRIA